MGKFKRLEQADMPIGVLNLELYLPGCGSLKEKRGRIKPLLVRLRREFNVSAAEMGYQDIWQSSQVGCVLISNDAASVRQQLGTITPWIERHWADIEVIDNRIEIL
jgi:uncharacterized protein